MVQFAKCMDKVSGEAVREILKLMSDPTVLSFGGGSPAKETFPVDVIKDVIDKSLSKNPVGLLQYGLTGGD